MNIIRIHKPSIRDFLKPIYIIVIYNILHKLQDYVSFGNGTQW